MKHKCTSNDLILMKYIITTLKVNSEQLNELLNGAFVVVIDDGKFFEGLLQLKGLNPPIYHRKSSHPSLKENNEKSLIVGGSAQGSSQIAIDGEVNRTFIAGKIRCGNRCKDILEQGDPAMYCKRLTHSIDIYNPPKSLPVNTWFQFESSRWQSPNQRLSDTWGHILTYFQYKLYRQNYGPNGASCFTGRPSSWNPLILKLRKNKVAS